MAATVAGMSSCEVNPAAKRWPPPPWLSAMRRTSTAPSERRLTRTVPSGSSFRTQVTSASRGAPQDVDEPLDLVEGDVVAGEHRLGDRGPHEALVVDELGLGERLAEQAQVRRSGAPRRGHGRGRATGTSNSVRRRARSNTSGVVVSYWNRPVSQTIAVYRHTAASRFSGRPRVSTRRCTTHPLAAASGSMTLIVP